MTEIFDDIRKLYTFRAPCGELAEYIEFFSESSSDASLQHLSASAFTIKMFPSWTPTFWISFGPSYGLTLDRKRFELAEQQAVVVTRDCITERHNHPDDYIFTVKFFPGALEKFFGIGQTKLTGQPNSLHNIIPHSIIQQIRNGGSFGERVNLMETFLLKNLPATSKKDHYHYIIRQSIGTYTSGELKYNVSELASKLFTSSRSINRYFSKVLGISPKTYFSSLRARAALTAFVTQRSEFVPENFGYYDRSHFYKEMRSFTGERIADRSGNGNNSGS